VGLVSLLASLALAAPAQAAIVSRGAASSRAWPSESATALTLSVPSGAQAGDLLVAELGFGRSGASAQPSLTAPSGWTLVRRTDSGTEGALAVYRHRLAAGETSFTWTASTAVGGAGFLAAFGGVDTTNPVDTSAGQTGTSAPSVTTSSAGEMLVAGFFGYRGGASGTTWSPPAGMNELGDATNGGSRSATLDAAPQAAAGASGAKTATPSQAQDYAIASVLALRPADTTGGGGSTGGPAAVPLLVDTDLFSDADDVGALATAFGLQLKGEASVKAILVNTRTSRPAVATSSWRCAAAVTSFYGFASTPIGTALPNNGTDANSPDFAGACAKLAPAGTPTPGSAVTAYRKALAAQPDGSAVIAATGYLGNLSALLSSPPDAISPLGGRDLVAQKVRLLVVMGGGYPSSPQETNLSGDPTAAGDVATRWPTKLVWTGVEVGDAVHTGQTISSVHPASSPVRVAYEAFVKPGNWIYSYDLTSVYHAVRPADALLTEVGPGTNTIDANGGNVFRTGSGNQYYLKLTNATSLDAAIEALLDTLPASDTTPPAISGVTASGGAVSWTTNEPSTSQVDYGTTSAYGSTTALDSTLTTSHRQTLPGLAPSTTYHFRVRSRDAAGNTATSSDQTFTTPATTAPLLADDFNTNTLDPARWTTASDGSTVTATNQELQISHPPGPWTKGSLTSVAPLDLTGRTLRVQLLRAANDGRSGSSYGETSIELYADDAHVAEFFVAGGSMTAWLNTGSGEVNLTPSWPAYSATAMQWLRFREAGGTLYWEYATAPDAWKVLASAPTPAFARSTRFKLIAGSNIGGVDVARVDNVTACC